MIRGAEIESKPCLVIIRSGMAGTSPLSGKWAQGQSILKEDSYEKIEANVDGR